MLHFSLISLIRYLSIVFCLGFSSWANALEIEDRIPVHVARIEIIQSIVPEYSRSYDGGYSETSLQHLVIRDQSMRNAISGKFARQEWKTEFRGEIGLTEFWALEIQVPLLEKKQDSTLQVKDDVPMDERVDANTVVENLSSESNHGIGDIWAELRYEFFYSYRWFISGSLLGKLPTGADSERVGFYSNNIGDGSASFGGSLNLSWYPTATRLRNGIKIKTTSQLQVERKDLKGKTGMLSSGNQLTLYYNWIWEQAKFFTGIEWESFLQLPSKFLGESVAGKRVDWLHWEVGYGNLSELEKNSFPLPWQFRFGYSHLLQGANVPNNPSWNLVWIAFF